MLKMGEFISIVFKPYQLKHISSSCLFLFQIVLKLCSENFKEIYSDTLCFKIYQLMNVKLLLIKETNASFIIKGIFLTYSHKKKIQVQKVKYTNNFTVLLRNLKLIFQNLILKENYNFMNCIIGNCFLYVLYYIQLNIHNFGT